MLHHLRIPLALVSIRILLRIRFPFLPPAFAVLGPLLKLALLCAVIFDTALRGTLLAVCLSATKGTTQVPSAGVTWMGDEKDAAMLAVSPASHQVGFASQNGPQDEIILQVEIADLTPAVPVLLLAPEPPDNPALQGHFFYVPKPAPSLIKSEPDTGSFPDRNYASLHSFARV